MKPLQIKYCYPSSLLFLIFLLCCTDTLPAQPGDGLGAAGQTDGPAAVMKPAERGTSVSSAQGLELTLSMDGWFPQITDKETGITYAFGTTAQAHLLRFGSFSLLARGGGYSIQTDSDTSMVYLGGAAGLGYFTPITERIGVGAFGFAGLGNIPDIKISGIDKKSYGLYELGLRLSSSLRLSASINLDLFAGYQRLATPVNGFIDAPAVGIGLRIAPGELLRSRGHLGFGDIEADPVFPVLRSWYDSEALGTVTIENREDGPIEKVRVFFYVPEYMGGSRLCASLPRLEPGEKLEVPLYAVFDERILSLTENSRTNALVDVEYSFYGSERSAAETFPLGIYHRNTMTWEDDRRAAAFVSPTDTASLWFARYSGSIARDRMRGNLPRNLQHALSIFEGLRLYGVNYVIDPNSAYEELSEDATAIDFLQYPSETLMYRGGDCDDLSILYSSLLESAGISTAFITIPGHIYMAFDLGLSAEEAKEQFFDPGLLIIKDGRAWAPIEITMVREGFVKAWRVGAKQWIDNDAAGMADFFPMRENWKRYPPSALPGAESRFVLPEESELMVAFDESIDRFMVREIGPVISDFRRRLAGKRDPETLNEYGVALAKAGMLEDSWEQFAEAADEGYVWAWNNLANIAFIRKDYELAYSYYQWAEELLSDDPVATLGLARTSYEMDRYSESSVLYNRLAAGAPTLAERFNYLESVYGGTGRAYSMTDRLSTTVWSEKGLDFGHEPAAAATAAPEDPPEDVATAEPKPSAERAEPESQTSFAPESDVKTETDAELAAAEESEPELEGESGGEDELEGESEREQEEELEAGAPPSAEEPEKEERPAYAPPKIEKKAPVDSEIASLMQRSQQSVISTIVVPPPETEEERSPAAPPTIAERAPEDIEIAQRRVEDEPPIVEPPEEEVETEPAAVPEPEMESEPEAKVAQVESESEPEVEKTEPDQ
ncbi:MAG: tetratricopeptide repeat protein, partial [Spirochaetaceae bacterium]